MKCYPCDHCIDPDGYHGHCILAGRDMKLTDPTPDWCPLRARSVMHAWQARYIVRVARKSQAMPRNPLVLEPIQSMRSRAERARRQWVSAVVEVLRWANA